MTTKLSRVVIYHEIYCSLTRSHDKLKTLQGTARVPMALKLRMMIT